MKRPILLPLLSAAFAVLFSIDTSGHDGRRDFSDYQILVTSKVAQENPSGQIAFFNGFSVGGDLGFALFHGDLAEYDVLPKGSQLRETFRPSYRLYAKRDIKFGLGAKIQYEQGALAGGRITGKQSPQVNFETEYKTVSLLATFDLFETLFKKNPEKENKLYLNAELGIGLSFYRSLSYWTGENEFVRDFVGYTVTDDNPLTQRYSTANKSKMENALAVPVGFTFGYRINYKTDLTLNYTLTNLMTDRLDTWDRDWSAKDKYSFIGVGLRFNFNRNSDNYPARKAKPNKRDAGNYSSSENEKQGGVFSNVFRSKKDDVQPNNISVNSPIQSRKGSDIATGGANSGNLDDVKLKMFELQLKLFEMQYLINSGGGTPAE